MLLPSVKTAHGRHEYFRLVENYRQAGKIHQCVVLHLGSKDPLAPHLDVLLRLLQADQREPHWVPSERTSTPQTWTWGPLRVAKGQPQGADKLLRPRPGS